MTKKQSTKANPDDNGEALAVNDERSNRATPDEEREGRPGDYDGSALEVNERTRDS